MYSVWFLLCGLSFNTFCGILLLVVRGYNTATLDCFHDRQIMSQSNIEATNPGTEISVTLGRAYMNINEFPVSF